MPGALDGVRVLDLGRYIAAPMGTAVMADLGAEVIRVESPRGGEDREQGPTSPTGDPFRFLMMNRNKKGITLDLERPEGKELFLELVKRSDVLVENYSPPVKEKLGITYEHLRQVNPRLIVVCCSAYGTNGPRRDQLGFDQTIQGEAGAMSFTGFPGLPTRCQLPFVDFSSALYSVIGVLISLMERSATGEGKQVEVALMDTAVSYIGFFGISGEYEVLQQTRALIGNASHYTYCDTFQTKDGMVTVGVISHPIWRRLAKLIGRTEMADDPRFANDSSRASHRDVINNEVGAWLAARTTDEVMASMFKARIPCGRVNSVPEMLADPQVAARRLFQPVEIPAAGVVNHPRVPLLINGQALEVRAAAPRVGEHNEEVYGRLLDLSASQLAELRAQGVI